MHLLGHSAHVANMFIWGGCIAVLNFWRKMMLPQVSQADTTTGVRNLCCKAAEVCRPQTGFNVRNVEFVRASALQKGRGSKTSSAALQPTQTHITSRFLFFMQPGPYAIQRVFLDSGSPAEPEPEPAPLGG